MEQEQTYIGGFNQGYKLNKYSPQLYAKLKGSLNKGNDYERGILEGAEQCEKEQGKEQGKESGKEQGRMDELADMRKPKQQQKEKQKDHER